MHPTPAVYAAATFFCTLLGGFFALRFSGWMDRIMAFSGGVLLAAGLLDLLPEAIALHAQRVNGAIEASTLHPPLLWAVGGFVLFYLAERTAILRSYHIHHHHPEQAHGVAAREGHEESSRALVGSNSSNRRQVGILGAAGLCIHSLLDGFSIGLAFHASAALGAVVAAAVIAHDFSDGVTTVTLLLSNDNSRSSSRFWLILDALAPLVGVGLASLLSLPGEWLSNLLGAFAGVFLYLGATHLLPEAHAISNSWPTVAWMLAGVGLMVLVTHWM